MRTIVPIGVPEPKSRLGGILADAERKAFAAAMLRDVLDAVDAAGGDPLVLADAPLDRLRAGTEATVVGIDAPVAVDDAPLTESVGRAVRKELREASAVAVVMADLAIVTRDAVRRLYDLGRENDITLAPGLGGGTNAMVISDPSYELDYHGASIRDHRKAAESIEASLAEIDSFRLGLDIDEPADLPEVLLHGDGRAAGFLRDAGFRVVTTEGRVVATRQGPG